MLLSPILSTQTSIEDSVAISKDTASPMSLIVWNDEINTFEWVIDTLIEVCNHTEDQAEQCAMIIHSKGKYPVKNGNYKMLKPMCNAITQRGIGATIEEVKQNA
jgi:ATP-dependent Clp protease adaptor protein ClpS